jgi:hypothetical protein
MSNPATEEQSMSMTTKTSEPIPWAKANQLHKSIFKYTLPNLTKSFRKYSHSMRKCMFWCSKADNSSSTESLPKISWVHNPSTLPQPANFLKAGLWHKHSNPLGFSLSSFQTRLSKNTKPSSSPKISPQFFKFQKCSPNTSTLNLSSLHWFIL